MTLNTLTYPYHTSTVQLPGNCEVAYVDEGKGERTLIFVHGLANYALVWRKNIDYLRQFYRCIAIDLPGNGLSDKNEHNFSIGFFADTLHHFIHTLSLKNVVIVGHSMGGQVALATLIKYPLAAQSLVLCAPAGFERFTALEKAMYAATINMFEYLGGEEHSLRKTIETSFYQNQRQGEGIITELVSQMKTYKGNYYKKMVDACIRAMLDEPVLDKLADVNFPYWCCSAAEMPLFPIG